MTEIICDVKPNMLHSPSSGDVRKEAETLKSDIASLQQQIDNTDDFELRRQLRARVKQKRERLKELGEDDYIAPSLGRDMTSPSRQTSLLVRKMQDSIIAKQQGQGQGASPSSASVSKATVGRSQSLLVRKTCAADALSPPAAGGGRMGLIFKELYASAKDRPLPEFRHMPPASPPPSFTNPFRSRAALQRRQSQDVTSSPSTLITSSSSPALPVGNDPARTDGTAATLVRPLADVRAEDGASGTFSCRCRPPSNVPVDDPLPTVTWVKDGHALTISDDQFIQTIQREANNDFSISFVIREIFPDDEGKYTCTITGVAWQLTSTACLTVLDYETMMREKNKKMTNGASPSHHATNGHHDASCKSDVSGSADHFDDSKVKVEPRAAVKPVARGAMRAFSMDAAAAGTGTTKPGAVTAAAAGGTKVCRVVQRSQSDIKQMLLNWIQAQTKEYTNVDIKNFSTCWNDGLAFCALIHHFYPDAFDYSKLDSKNPEKNFQLAFDTAEKRAGIAPLLDVDDMMKMRTNPDWKCIFVYVQSFYRRFYRQTVAKSGSGEGSEGPSTPTTPHTPLSPSGSTSSEN